MLNDSQLPQPTPEQIAQQLHLMDLRLNQHYPGYLEQLEQLREPCVCVQEGEWSPTLKHWRTTWEGHNHGS